MAVSDVVLVVVGTDVVGTAIVDTAVVGCISSIVYKMFCNHLYIVYNYNVF